jgi:hypothetical protein
MKPVTRLGQTALAPTRVEQDILFRATVIPFVAVVGGVFVGYLLVKPTIDDIRFVINALGTIFPILKRD